MNEIDPIRAVVKPGQQRRFAPEHLERAAVAVLGGNGVPRDSAQLVADTLVSADLWGHPSHGIMRLSPYVARLQSGVMNPVARVDRLLDRGPVALLDGNDGIGQVIAETMTREAVDRARKHGVAAVSARNSNHVGCLGYFTRLAAAEGCIGIFLTNASPAMAPWGGRDARVGTNPWSIAAPRGEGGAIAIDLANTAAARGKIHVARQRGTSIPEGWALDANGVPTTDPTRALEGVLLPMAGHKGYAIAVMIDVLAGVLSGSAIGSEVAGPYQAERRGGTGHLFVALDVSSFIEPAKFAERVEALVADIRGTEPASAGSVPLIPGELEQRNASRARAEGIALPNGVVDELRRLLREAGADATLPSLGIG